MSDSPICGRISRRAKPASWQAACGRSEPQRGPGRERVIIVSGGAIHAHRLETDVPDIAGKWVLLTGASRGIGRQVAGAFADRGCKLILHSRKLEHTPSRWPSSSLAG
jgi:hypothetical protein